MKLENENDGFTVQVIYDGDHFPIVHIQTNDGYLDENNRPTVSVSINGKEIHPMFSQDI